MLHTIDEILFANLDVTSAVSAWAIAHIALYSKQQAPLREALQVAAYSAESLEEQVMQALSVDMLDCCVKESARLQPLLALTFPETTVKPLTIAGYNIPKGV